MTSSKIEVTGLDVHEKLRNMVKSYGVMMTAVPAETVGSMQAQMSSATVKKTGNLPQNIAEAVEEATPGMIQPTNSCGQASNEVCALLLGEEGVSKLEEADYQTLSDTGANLTSALPDSDSLIRVEVDRYNSPQSYCKIKKGDFNPDTAEKNKIYLLEDQLLYLDDKRMVTDLGLNQGECQKLFSDIQKPEYQNYSLYDPYIEEDDGPDEAAICKIAETVKAQNINCWYGTHSFTLFSPKALDNAARQLYPYQAYWTKHTLQDWFSGNKDEDLSKMGSAEYVKQLALLGTTKSTKERSDTYGALFSPPGKEKVFCIGINEKQQPLRVKFKIAEVDPELALANLQEVQDFIDQNYPGEDVEAQSELYRIKAQSAMTKQLETLLIQPVVKQGPIVPSSIGKLTISEGAQELMQRYKSSLASAKYGETAILRKENLKMIAKQADSFSKEEREKLIEFFKVLPQEELLDIKHHSNTAQEAWDQKYGLVPRNS